MKKIFGKILFILWPEYMRNGNKFSRNLVLKHWVIQKVFRINSHVPWPVHWSSKIKQPSKVKRGDRCPGLSAGCHIDGRNGISFGNNVWVGPRVSIISMNHDVNDYYKYTKGSEIVIGDNCWLGVNSVILPEVQLGSHTIVAAGAVVTKSFLEGNVILAGTPARVIKLLDDYTNE